MADAGKLTVELTHEAQCLHVQLNAPPGNVLDTQMMAEFESTLADHNNKPDLKALLITASGRNFSYGASVEEHSPEHVHDMLPRMHRLIRKLVEVPLFTIVSVRGRCLGGGLELALCCDRIVCAPDSSLGLPEIKLAVFAPTASALLPLRVGEARAVQMLASGHTVSANRAAELGLVDRVSDQPDVSANNWLESNILGNSASALRHALWAARWQRRHAVTQTLTTLEARYLDQLMETADAREGIDAFMNKRKPVYVNA